MAASRKVVPMKFDAADWLKDPAVRMCSPATRGIWMDALCLMHIDDRQGVLSGTYASLARALGATPKEIKRAITELKDFRAAKVTRTGDRTELVNRRMQREYKSRTQGRQRQIRFRTKGVGDIAATPDGYLAGLSGNADVTASLDPNGEVEKTLSTIEEEEELRREEKNEERRSQKSKRVELEWRLEKVWEAHVTAHRNFYKEIHGYSPGRTPTLHPDDIETPILNALKLHDSELLEPSQRESWEMFSVVRAAGVGIYYSKWHTGQDPKNSVSEGGKRYLEHWRPWKKQRGKADPIPGFAELYFAEVDKRSQRKRRS